MFEFDGTFRRLPIAPNWQPFSERFSTGKRTKHSNYTQTLFSFDIILNTYYSIEIDACFAIIEATEQNSCCDFHYHLQYTTKNTIISIYLVLFEEKLFLFLLQIGFWPGINQL